ncbi:MAG: MaoC family dehydratase N-terminal domain-containing protein [Deltaproteobacteria bacterium]|nr:MaoC family dehydratase N-terminal domain-containing protein [Deltaproteobacteria bacterium]
MARKKLYFEDVKEGDDLPSFTVENLTRTDFVKYAGSSGDFNPIHHDQTFAEASGNPTVFAMGMMNAGILSRLVSDYAGLENLRKYKVRFATRVWPGDSVTCKGKVTRKAVENGEKIIEGELMALNQKGEVAIQGSFRAALPSRS